MAFLEISESGSTRRADLHAQSCTIGRSPDCGLVLTSDAVSRHHARVSLRDGHHVVEDLGSRNGTRLNGRPLTAPTVLSDHDEIRIGVARILYRSDPGSGSGTALGIRMRSDSPAGMTIVSRIDTSRSEAVMPTDSTRQLRVVLDIMKTLLGTYDLDQVQQRILKELLEVFPQGDVGVLLLVDAQGELLPHIVQHRDGHHDAPAEVSRTIAQRVLNHREAVLTADAGSDSRWSESPSITEFKIRSVMCVPLSIRDQPPIGVLQLHGEREGVAFTKQDLELLTYVAVASATAIENARMRDQLLAQERLRHDLEVARSVQQSLLPTSSPAAKRHAFFHRYVPAERVGGDYFGFGTSDDGCISVAIGDVSGKGLPAALWMARLSSDIRYAMRIEASPHRALARLHRELIQILPEDRFVTLLLAVLDPIQHQVQLANAGHQPPLLRRANGEVESIGASHVGLPLGIDESLDVAYPVTSLKLEPGDFLLAATDGVTEARNLAGEFFGEDRLHRVMQKAGPSAEAIGEAVCDAVVRFSAGARQRDDLTIVCFGRRADVD